MAWDFQTIRNQAQKEADSICDNTSLESFRIKYLGKKGLIPQVYASLSTASKEDKPLLGKNANELKNFISGLIEEKKLSVKDTINQSSKSNIDVTLPGVANDLGHSHLLTQTMDEICGLFEKLGFIVQEGPEIETEFNNFDALNIPSNHPSRDGFDTFYVDQVDPGDKDKKLLLRSQTSPVQIRVMKANKPPLAVVVPGKVYRPDAVDASHSFMFHQIEGLLVDQDIKFSHLKGLLTTFCNRFFGDNIKMRFRPHFFPFTEPSAEIDISWEKGKKDWLEIMGCGMVHPQVFKAVGYPKGKYTGLAFGLGVERIAMLRYGIRDIRLFYENDKRFLEQF
ncbi:MAG: phenylalanine--tRNA ligase subunit alpha [Omnitrophica WOR_2 bacterium GWF2_38_59]|nr:MAG: phenylalanine--tRNA ligase subunit alpha [Omnitrophica WOR_2 bacterium GWA2_37_7]OGX22700.1 MAG: phenylalanine--tRNA ligase subunit alpha [Omnitrophica WOR_2 bacterium GWF2_38_59]OGX49933.1 MAG: phenylalanine--tRNA ligase subunit alpha [Omnitrophica WOR_2 bacterium RIFOXYA2_FULL_38_17]OGX53703.1 MAG: phenylalanine--tRNA ligase subunit alpha [Omnitrophica WOR_2 bacterium RIFOXYA12_FULL_38_10]OGX56554.1 MAG: phenylalanine--tRNA ligase subunit alpha [Omnitrophica WOR_2 bacterium RIFOXYB2_F